MSSFVQSRRANLHSVLLGGTCADEAETSLEVGGVVAACHQLLDFCHDDEYGSQVQEACPVSCGLCSGPLGARTPPPRASGLLPPSLPAPRCGSLRR